MAVLLIVAFLSGLVTIAAPCIWPLLPIVLSSTASGGKAKPLGVTMGIMVSFGALTLLLSSLVAMLHLDPDVLRTLAVAVIGFLGLVMIVPRLGEITESLVSRLSSHFGARPEGKGFTPGFVTGLSLGVVWTPCAGPVLATVAALSATRQLSPELAAVTAAYVTGVGVPLFVFAYGGQRIIQRTTIFNRYTGRVQQLFGLVMILTAVLIYTNSDKVIQIKLLDIFPFFNQATAAFENNPTVTSQLANLTGKKDNNSVQAPIISDLPKMERAPDFTGITKWLNLPSGETQLSLEGLKGKVVLVDFWTYTCINCIRTLPHVTGWYEKYKNDGLVVVGVHSPEFEFEKKTENVQAAIKRYKINYPVAQDNNYATWDAYANRFWPAEYLIDKNGYIRMTHFGEGNYNEMEEAIRSLLAETGEKIEGNLSNLPDQTPQIALSPETYLGAGRMSFFYPDGNTGEGERKFSLAKNLPINSFDLGGDWTITGESAVSGQGAVLEYHFQADRVFLVLRPGSSTTAQVRVLLDGQAVSAEEAGADVTGGVMVINQDRLYNLINLRGGGGEHILRLEFMMPGTEAYAFTFG